MKKLALFATISFVALTGVALAADPLNADRPSFFVGGSVGSTTDKSSRIDLGANFGYQYGPYVRAEVDYDNVRRTTGVGNTLTVDGVAQYRIPNSTVTPYVLAGGGIGFNALANVKTGDEVALYNVGAGVRVAVSNNVELDVRYKDVAPFNNDHVTVKRADVVTAGVNYRF